ncbi:11737_t:CDS:2 [Entrophospora sp. SA101]|nr:6250_t:CDS:2 [Entrophospora sp. SA101]CAJ0841139.1 11737_t:CDS:2 [Entrophospora sp. SA101]
MLKKPDKKRKHDVDTVDKSSIKMDESKKKSNKKKSKKSSNNPSKKSFTISIALPGSIIDNAQTPELKSYLAVVIFNEGLNLTNSDPNESSNIFLARILQYLETPQYLRKDLFPVHKDLKYAGLLNPLDCPHHVRQEEKSQYREGVVIDTKPKGMEGALVNAGLKKNVLIDQQINPGVRVTLDMGDYTVVKNAKVVSPKTPSENGIYWGYQIRLANSISKVFTESPYPDGYDISIGTSERGKIVDEVINELPEFKHLLIVFGGLSGLEMVIDKDKDLECAGEEADALFDLWINTCPNQGSRTIRTEVL